MGRWQPDARGRLAEAALGLFLERGYDRTTAADIAERAGLTERTFYRHFADKREVLFGGSAPLQELLVRRLSDDPDAARPLDAVCRAFEAVGDFFGDPCWPRLRQQVIEQSPELRERELIKLSTLSAALAQALRDGGVAEPAASLSAEAGTAVFRVAVGRWVDQQDEGAVTFAGLVQQSLADLRTVTGD